MLSFDSLGRLSKSIGKWCLEANYWRYFCWNVLLKLHNLLSSDEQLLLCHSFFISKKKILRRFPAFYSRSCFATINLLNTRFHSFIKSGDVIPDPTPFWPLSRPLLTISPTQFWLFASYSLALFKTFFSTLLWPIEIPSMHFRNQSFPIGGDCTIFYEIRMIHRWSSINMQHGQFLGEKVLAVY